MGVSRPGHLARVWERFLAGEEVDLSTLRPEVAASWKRCQELGVEPSLHQAPAGEAHTSPVDEDLVEASRPVVDFLNDALLGAGTLIDLTNRHGRILLTIGGRRALDVASQINGLPGSLWEEGVVGTNVIGTGIVHRKPIQICWEEHFVEKWHKWACCSAPVFHPFHRELVGILAIAGFREVPHPRVLELTTTAAGLVSNALRLTEAERQGRVVEAYGELSRRYPNAPVLATDAFGYVLRASQAARSLQHVLRVSEATRSLQQNAASSSPHVGEWLGLREEWPVDLDSREELFLRTASGAQVVAQPVAHDGRIVGHVLLLPEKGSCGRSRPSRSKWHASFGVTDILGDDEGLHQNIRTAMRAGETDYPVLLVGESGTGKELFAHAIHGASSRRAGPFVTVNCGTLSHELAVAELCGYEAGAFTGADRRAKSGVLEEAEGGTLFLDEIQDLEPKGQSVLLRFFETGSFVRLGGTQPVSCDVRIVAASNLTVEEIKRGGALRSDLLHRLNCIHIRIPPLRERIGDLRTIGDHHLREELRYAGAVDDAVWRTLERYDWPGNVRELRNVLLRATLNADGSGLTVADLPPEVRGGPERRIESDPPGMHRKAKEAENALHEAGGDVVEAARKLGVHRSTLYRRLARSAHRRL